MVVLETVREELGHEKLLVLESDAVGFVQGRSARKLFDEMPVTNQPAVGEAGEALGAGGDWHFWSSHQVLSRCVFGTCLCTKIYILSFGLYQRKSPLAIN